MSITNWGKEECLAFLMLNAAKADMHVTADEINWIQAKFGQPAYQTALTLFEKQSDFDNLQTILLIKSHYFPGEEGLQKLRGDLVSLFQIDGSFSLLEQNYLRALDRLLR
jgi:hypothetical protein